MTSPAASKIPQPLTPRPPLRRRVRTFATVLATVGVAVAVGAAVWWIGIRDPPPGPLQNPNGDSVAIGRHAGQVWAYGQAVAWNTGKKPAVLKRIWLVKATPGLEVLDTRLGGPKRRLLSLATWSQWPSPNFSDLHPVAGFRIDPMSQPKGKRGAEFIFVLRAKKPGRYISRAVGVEYTVDGSDHRSYITSALGVCVTATDQPLDRNCPTPEPLSSQEINE